MDVTEHLEVACSPERLFSLVEDLSVYPTWLTIVPRADRADGDRERPTWRVELRGRVGPLARSKLLSMERTVHDPDRRVVFERAEDDGRSHAAWRLEAVVAPAEGGASLTMSLHYGGTLAGPLLERMLRDEIEASRPRLMALAEASTAG